MRPLEFPQREHPRHRVLVPRSVQSGEKITLDSDRVHASESQGRCRPLVGRSAFQRSMQQPHGTVTPHEILERTRARRPKAADEGVPAPRPRELPWSRGRLGHGDETRL